MKNFIITLILVLFSTSAFAGSCPMMAKQVDDKIEQVQQLRDDAMAAHESGDHAKSEELLNQAIELFKN
jgi:hypothetical protein|tara:strand:+ start:745 stop:951 length:207 start_codon:yes stop_codon:yes gene_type:complete